MTPPRKRVRTGKKPVNAQNATGRLSELPLDVVLEIFRYLHPLDIFHLSRTSSSFRAFLTGSSSVKIWKEAFDALEPGFPTCPKHLTFPRYAQLAFEEICDICHNPTTEPTIWIFYARYCNSCKDTRFRGCLPAPLRKDDLFKNNVNDKIFPSISVRRAIKYHKPEVEAFADFFLSLESDQNKHDAIENKHAATVAMTKDVSECERWFLQVTRARADKLYQERCAQQREIQAIKDARITDIYKRLDEQGWTEELNYLGRTSFSPLGRHPLVDKPKKLTSKGWAGISLTLNKFLEKKKTERIDTSNGYIFSKRFGLLTNFAFYFYDKNSLNSTFLPKTVDLCYFPEVRELMSRDLTVNITKEDIRSVLEPVFSDLLVRWREGIDAELVALVVTQLGLSDDVRPLELAGLLFKCSCGTALTYPAILSHGCLHRAFYLDQEPPLPYEVRPMCTFHIRPWSCSKLDLTLCAEKVATMIKTCGGDYKTTTCEELDRLDPRLSCTLCRVNPGRKIIMTWRTARSHCVSHHSRALPEEALWEIVEGDEAARAKELEQASEKLSRQEYEDDPNWLCCHCLLVGGVSKAKRVDHVIQSHQVTHPAEGRDYYRRLSSEPFVLKPVALISEDCRVGSLLPWEKKMLVDGRAAWYRFPSPPPPE